MRYGRIPVLARDRVTNPIGKLQVYGWHGKSRPSPFKNQKRAKREAPLGTVLTIEEIRTASLEYAFGERLTCRLRARYHALPS